MSKSQAFQQDVLALAYQNEVPAGSIFDSLGDGVGPSAADGNVYLAFHTALPGDAGDQETSEATFTGYARVALPRDSATWTLVAEQIENLVGAESPANTGSSQDIVAWSLGTAASGAGYIIHQAPLSFAFNPRVCVTVAGIVYCDNHNLAADDRVAFTHGDGGALPAELTEGAFVWVRAGPTEDTFTVSATQGGAQIVVGDGGGRIYKGEPVTVGASETLYIPASEILIRESGDTADPVPNPGGGGVMQAFVLGDAAHYGTEIRLQFDQQYLVGEYRYEGSQDFWVYAPDGLTVTQKIPAYDYRDDGPGPGGAQQYVYQQNPPINVEWHANGMHANPRAHLTTHALDSTSYAVGATPPFDQYLNNANIARKLVEVGPQLISPNTTLVAAVSKNQAFQESQLYSLMLVTVVDTVPADGAFRPCYCGTDKSMAYTTADVDWAKLPSLPLPATVATWSDVERRTRGPLYEAPAGRNEQTYHRPEFHFPSSYGREITNNLGVAHLMVLLDFTQAEKEKTVYDLVQIGLDRWKISTLNRWTGFSNVGHWFADAGQGIGSKWSVAFAGYMLNAATIVNEAKWPAAISSPLQLWTEDLQSFVVSETSAGVYNYGLCGYGPLPGGASENWIPEGTPDWSSSHWEQVVHGLLPPDEMAAWDTGQPGHALFPRNFAGENCATPFTNYRICCASLVQWAEQMASRVLEKFSGEPIATDIFTPAFFHYLKGGTVGGRTFGYLQNNAAWGRSNFNFRNAGLLPSMQGVTAAFWSAYGSDYTTYPIPALTDPWNAGGD